MGVEALPDGTKIADYLARLGELEVSAREAKRGAWEHSVPAQSHPVVEEEKEIAEPSRWLERSGFAAFGATAMGVIWGFCHWRRRERRGGFSG